MGEAIDEAPAKKNLKANPMLTDDFLYSKNLAPPVFSQFRMVAESGVTDLVNLTDGTAAPVSEIVTRLESARSEADKNREELEKLCGKLTREPAGPDDVKFDRYYCEALQSGVYSREKKAYEEAKLSWSRTRPSKNQSGLEAVKRHAEDLRVIGETKNIIDLHLIADNNRQMEEIEKLEREHLV